MLVIDLLLGNLLYGHPITQSDLNNLGLARHAGGLSVYTLSPQRLNTHGRQSLTADLMAKLKVTCYVGDIAGEDHTVLLCIMAGQDNSELTPIRETALQRHVCRAV